MFAGAAFNSTIGIILVRVVGERYEIAKTKLDDYKTTYYKQFGVQLSIGEIRKYENILADAAKELGMDAEAKAFKKHKAT